MSYRAMLAIRAPGTMGDPGRQLTIADLQALRARINQGLALLSGSVLQVNHQAKAASVELLIDVPAWTTAQARQFLRSVFAATDWIASLRMWRTDAEEVFFEGALRANQLVFREKPEPPVWAVTTEGRP